ncbi:MAG: SRPBCC family protein [Actinobacteria bacterium]|nr:SRPBCC family protein [Actinomycetota bacterium]
MALRSEGTITVEAEPKQVLEWILDMDRYRQVDQKIASVKQQPTLDEDGRGTLRYRGRLRGLLGPVDTQTVELDRWQRLVITGDPQAWTRRLFDFTGTFRCTPTDAGTEVTHTEEFAFHPALVHRLASRWLQGWLDSTMTDEMTALKRAVEAEVGSAG